MHAKGETARIAPYASYLIVVLANQRNLWLPIMSPLLTI